MVSDLAIGALTVLGGAISGIIGVAYSEYQSRRERQKELKEWYNTTIQLAERVERLGSDEFGASGEYIGDGLSGVIGRLTGHLMDAPTGANRDIVEIGEKLASECENARQLLRGERIRNARSNDSEFGSPIDSAIGEARNVRREATNAKKEVGWL